MKRTRNTQVTTTGHHKGRKPCTVWIPQDVWIALRVAAARSSQDIYAIVEEALRRHPLVKEELTDARQS